MKKHSVGLLELETAVLECLLEKTPLSPLGVNLQGFNCNLFQGFHTSFLQFLFICLISKCFLFMFVFYVRFLLILHCC
jgi:hypothetical protein